MRKTLLSCSILGALFSFNVLAEERVIDPSDLTQVYTQAAVFVTSDADIRVSSMLTGAWNEDISFAGFIEGNFGDRHADDEDKLGADYLGGRAQYFQVHATDSSMMPRVGFSTDLIHQKTVGLKDTTLFSAGAIGLINPAYTPGMMVFPNAAYTVGDVLGESADGYMLNLFATVQIGDSGAFVQMWPEYFNVSGDVAEMESKSFNVMVNAPVKSDRTLWLMTKLEYNSTDTVLPSGDVIDGDPQLKAEIGMKWFF